MKNNRGIQLLIEFGPLEFQGAMVWIPLESGVNAV